MYRLRHGEPGHPDIKKSESESEFQDESPGYNKKAPLSQGYWSINVLIIYKLS
jgi:hypothetical protein